MKYKEQTEAFVRETNKKVKQTARKLLKIWPWGKKKSERAFLGQDAFRKGCYTLEESAFHFLT